MTQRMSCIGSVQCLYTLQGISSINYASETQQNDKGVLNALITACDWPDWLREKPEVAGSRYIASRGLAPSAAIPYPNLVVDC